MSKKVLIETLGWYGTIAILGAYFLNSFSLIPTGSFWYAFLNTTGAMGIVIEAYSKKDCQPVVLNLIWTLIGVVSLIRVIVQ